MPEIVELEVRQASGHTGGLKGVPDGTGPSANSPQPTKKVLRVIQVIPLIVMGLRLHGFLSGHGYHRRFPHHTRVLDHPDRAFDLRRFHRVRVSTGL